MNDHNPYAPPVSEVADAPVPPSSVRKPVSLWLLQAFCALLAIFLFFPISVSVEMVSFATGMARVSAILSVAILLLLILLLVWTIVAAQLRSQFGRWLGVFVMGSLAAIMVLVVVNSQTSGHMPLSVQLGFYGVAALVEIAALLLLYFPAFSKRARAWYEKA